MEHVQRLWVTDYRNSTGNLDLTPPSANTIANRIARRHAYLRGLIIATSVGLIFILLDNAFVAQHLFKAVE